ncbi:MAG TPA: efflux RND transporter periplasmic adaptor subunit [bacterium]|nr:efflux RND transporter periplasmic adaptor subunit [bacterium]
MNRLIPAVEAVQVQFGSLPLTERLSGVVRAKNLVTIYPEVNAIIVEVYVENGQYVEAGQPLVRLRDREFQERLRQARASYQIALAQAKQAEARLNEVRSELTRVEALHEKGLTSAMELEAARTRAISAEADYELAEARIEQATATVDEREESLSQTIIRAPVSGSVGNRNAEIGMLVSGNTRLFTLGQLDSVRIEVVLTDRMLNYIEEGQRTEIAPEGGLAEPRVASLSRITPFLHPVTHSTDAEIDLVNSDRRLKSGMFVTVDIYYGESEQAALVPLSAIYENPATGVTGVYVSHDIPTQESIGTVAADERISLTEPVSFAFVPVEVLARGHMSAGVTGVEPGTWVVTLGQDMLGSESGTARVRQVTWDWVESLQRLQHEDLLKEVVNRQRTVPDDTTSEDQTIHTSS